EQPAVDAAIVEALRCRVERAGAQDADVFLPARPRRQHAECSVAVAGRDDALDEAARLGDLHRGRLVQLAVESENAAEGAERIALVGFPERLLECGANGGAARVIVLDDHGGRLGELADEIEGAVEVEQVVVRQLLAVQCLGSRDAGGTLATLGVERRLLMRVFSITQGAALLEGQVERGGGTGGGRRPPPGPGARGADGGRLGRGAWEG